MPSVTDTYLPALDLHLGIHLTKRIPIADQQRQRAEVEEILRRFRCQPGVVLADEVGMGKTFVALGVAYSVSARSPRGPVIVMVPANLIDKWEQDLEVFCELYVENRKPLRRDRTSGKQWTSPSTLRYGVARDSVGLLKLLDDPARERCQVIFLAQGAMSRRQSDKWVRLALIAEALRCHGRGKATRLIQVKNQIHRFLAKLLWAVGEERAQGMGDELWQRLLRTSPETWREIYNNSVRDDCWHLDDDPVPKAVVRAVRRVSLKALADALEGMPVRARGGDARIDERISAARRVLRKVEEDLWKVVLAEASWRSPLLVMDEAHHLKNPGTSLARQLQSADLEHDLSTGDGALANAFDRMLFLTATPFQLGHHELVRVLERFGDARWDDSELGERERFRDQIKQLEGNLDDAQRAAIALQRSWSKLSPDDCNGNTEAWWTQIVQSPRDLLTYPQRAVVDAYSSLKLRRDVAEAALRPWIVRHNKGTFWEGTNITRRMRLDGSAVETGSPSLSGLAIPGQQLLPFFLAARSAVNPAQDLLGEALCSSYEAFRFTRQNRVARKDEQDMTSDTATIQAHAKWYLGEFDLALEAASGSQHPKVAATVKRVVDLWEAGEKVLVFGFYRETCGALRVHISQEIERRMISLAQRRLREAGVEAGRSEVEQRIERIQRRFFDDVRSPARKALDEALKGILHATERAPEAESLSTGEFEAVSEVMRRFLRVSTTLIRSFPIAQWEALAPADAVTKMLEQTDDSGSSWRRKFEGFVDFLNRCSVEERSFYLEASQRVQTRGIRVEDDESEESNAEGAKLTLANVQVATGATKREARTRLMRAFNTPFFPDVLVCSAVMGEGIDLQRFCRHVIHHDLDWNPSTIEQRTGRIDRLGCKAEGRHPILAYLPYLAGTADERQYRVMSDRERWFRVVMGQDEVAKLITPESSNSVPLPECMAKELSFNLCVGLRTGSGEGLTATAIL